MNKQIKTRDFITSRIDSLLNGDISVPIFGEEMVAYLAFELIRQLFIIGFIFPFFSSESMGDS